MVLAKYIAICALLCVFKTNLYGQENPQPSDSSGVKVKIMNIDRMIKNNAFRKGEWLKFVIRYGPVKAGYAYMEIPDIVKINGKPCFHIISRAESNDFFSAFYKVRDRVESFIDTTGIFPWHFEKHLREGKFSADVINIFDQKNQRVIARKDTFQVPLYVQDVLSAFYYVRTQDLKIGNHFSVDNFSDGKNYPLEVKVLKKENVRVKAGKFYCFVVEPILKSTGIFKQKGRLKVWMTEDPTHTPVMMKSEIVVGSIVAELIDYRGVNPIKR
jgi:hypothetical protein